MSAKYKIKKNKYIQLRVDLDASIGWPKGIGITRTETELPPYDECFQEDGSKDVLLAVKMNKYSKEQQALFDPTDEISDEEYKDKKEKASKDKDKKLSA